ncbi:macrophage erythroblast attacher [Phthorimaea operculella]|nr:macrophage erythroblast attacher [Phthorimaea operculella]
MYRACAEVERGLALRRTARALQWCADNKSKLRKLNSTMEFNIRIQLSKIADLHGRSVRLSGIHRFCAEVEWRLALRRTARALQWCADNKSKLRKLNSTMEFNIRIQSDIYRACAEVERGLALRRTARALQWCADNKSKLRKLNSTMEFNIRIQLSKIPYSNGRTVRLSGIYRACAEVERGLALRRTARALQWCADNKSKLRKLNSTMEFNIRIQLSKIVFWNGGTVRLSDIYRFSAEVERGLALRRTARALQWCADNKSKLRKLNSTMEFNIRIQVSDLEALSVHKQAIECLYRSRTNYNAQQIYRFSAEVERGLALRRTARALQWCADNKSKLRKLNSTMEFNIRIQVSDLDARMSKIVLAALSIHKLSDIYRACAEVERGLALRRTARALQWCADNKSKLRKLNSTMEFNIRIQAYSVACLRAVRLSDIYRACAEVERGLALRRTARALQWCADNKSKLRKLNSTMEFNIRIQVSHLDARLSDMYRACAEVERWLALRRTARALQWCADNKSKLRKLNSTMEFNIRIQTLWPPYNIYNATNITPEKLFDETHSTVRMSDIYRACAEVERGLALRRTARALQWCADNKSKLRKLNSTMEFNIRIQLLKMAHSNDHSVRLSDIYRACAEVERGLALRRTARALQWCADNKSKLRKLNSTMEFNIRIQEFIELVREDKRLDAVKYAKKHFSQYEEGQLEDIQHCMGMLAFPKDTDVEPYKGLLAPSRWTALVQQFRSEHARLLHPARLPALPVAAQLGLHALNTPQCSSSCSVSAGCPACSWPLSALARQLPHAHVSHSRLVCRLSGKPLDEHNQPMVLPNGQVYGEKALKEMMKEHGSIICPKTKEVFCMKRVEKVYVM